MTKATTPTSCPSQGTIATDIAPKQANFVQMARIARQPVEAGPGLRIDLRNGKVFFVVTLYRPTQPVALLNAEVSRARSAVH